MRRPFSRKQSHAAEVEAPAAPPGVGVGGEPQQRHTPRGADPYVVRRLHVSPESRRVGAVGSVRPADAPKPEPKPAPFVDRPTLDLVALPRERERIRRLGEEEASARAWASPPPQVVTWIDGVVYSD